MDLGHLDAFSVRQAAAEYLALGREGFLAKHGYAKSAHWIHLEGDSLDAQAVAGVAYGYTHPLRGPIAPDEFAGGGVRGSSGIAATGLRH